MSEQETVLVDGMFFKKKSEKAPDFVKGHIGLKVDELVSFLQKHKKTDGWVNVDLLKSKQGKLYFKLDTWQPDKSNEQEAPPLTDEDVPF